MIVFAPASPAPPTVVYHWWFPVDNLKKTAASKELLREIKSRPDFEDFELFSTDINEGLGGAEGPIGSWFEVAFNAKIGKAFLIWGSDVEFRERHAIGWVDCTSPDEALDIYYDHACTEGPTPTFGLT